MQTDIGAMQLVLSDRVNVRFQRAKREIQRGVQIGIPSVIICCDFLSLLKKSFTFFKQHRSNSVDIGHLSVNAFSSFCTSS
jgi:hypothetical protein